MPYYPDNHMITLSAGKGIIDVAEDAVEPFRIDYSSSTAGLILRSAESYMQKNGVDSSRNIRILIAHGNSCGEYVYNDPIDGFKPVEDWINQHERKHGALCIAVCNTNGIRLRKRWSDLIYPTSLCSIDDIIEAASGSSRIFTILRRNSLLDVVQTKAYYGASNFI